MRYIGKTKANLIAGIAAVAVTLCIRHLIYTPRLQSAHRLGHLHLCLHCNLPHHQPCRQPPAQETPLTTPAFNHVKITTVR